MEPFFVLIIISAQEWNYSLIIGEYILIANNFVEGTVFVANMIAFKKKNGVYNDDSPLLGIAWRRGFQKKNAMVIASRAGRKFSALRAAHCIYATLLKMYNTFETGLVKSKNAVKLLKHLVMLSRMK